MAAGGASANAEYEHGTDNPPPDLLKPNRRLSRKKRSSSYPSIAVLLAGSGFIGAILAVLAGLLLTEPAAAQTIGRGLFADADRATRDVLAFLGDIGKGRHAVLGDMLFVFNAGVLALAGFLLVWHTVAGTLDTRPRGALRLRRLGDRAHRRRHRPDGAAAGRHERRPVRGDRPCPPRRRLRQRGLEAVLRGSAWRGQTHRAPAPRGRLARRHFQNPDSGDLPLCG